MIFCQSLIPWKSICREPGTEQGSFGCSSCKDFLETLSKLQAPRPSACACEQKGSEPAARTLPKSMGGSCCRAGLCRSRGRSKASGGTAVGGLRCSQPACSRDTDQRRCPRSHRGHHRRPRGSHGGRAGWGSGHRMLTHNS